MTIQVGHKWPAFIVMISFGFILVDYQTGLWEKYFVTGDWSQSTIHAIVCGVDGVIIACTCNWQSISEIKIYIA